MLKKYKPSEYMDLVNKLIFENYSNEKFYSPLQLNGITKLSGGRSTPVLISWEDIYYVEIKGENHKVEFKWGIIKEMEFNTESIDTIKDLINFIPTINIYGFFHREDFYGEKIAKRFIQTNNFKTIDLFSTDVPFSDIDVNKLPLKKALEKIIQTKN